MSDTMQVETVEVKRGQGRPKGSKNAPKTPATVTLAFGDGTLTADNGAVYNGAMWTVDGYTLAEVAVELAAAREIVARFENYESALGLPAIDKSNPGKSIKGLNLDSASAVLEFLKHAA